MKANELRIGNFIYNPFNEINKVEFIDGANHYIRCEAFAERPCEEFTPIPLTKEWLLKFGFENPYSKKYFIKSISGDFENGTYVFFNPIFTGIAISASGLEEGIFKIKIKYVHQLQNLFFAITGEELKVDLYDR